MADVEVDYLVVGAGASGMAFVDALVAERDDCDVLLVDRRHRPGGHWLDAYPFVRLHQPSATYGVTSRRLGEDRIDRSGPNAGFYERATAAEIVGYYDAVLEQVLLPTGRVRFAGLVEHTAGADGTHTLRSLVTGDERTVHVRRRLVDATYTESSIPKTHTPGFAIDAGATVVPPNDLVLPGVPPSGYTVIGGGKTAMDTCGWLLDMGVDPDRIRWVRSRDGWYFNRAYTQPGELVGSFMQLQARWIAAAAEAEDARDFAHRLEASEVFLRIDPAVEPTAFRGATTSVAEVAALRSIDDVVRRGRVRQVAADRITFDDGELPTPPGHVYVDCTAAGVRPTTPRPLFAPGHLTLEYVTLGFVPWGAATVGAVEALVDGDDDLKNQLCPPVVFTGHVDDLLAFADAGMRGLGARSTVPALAAWTEACRLNPARGASAHLDDPAVADAFEVMAASLFPALENLERLLAATGSDQAPAPLS
ncbi:NAD(P)-binding protein [Dermatobacter hominis]|uniref:NAD(P)-binding protein n=1 Tax=Dermatobacter hominis TaxID=2884263 RepID=UPI001D11439C|nr:NAD(P)-binding protein [Dermatobacter hominis]UDY34997.1 NAD(P)-binding protein [Dermatobacter hominis]